MKSIREIFKNNPSLLNEPEVAQLLAYCEELQDEIVAFKFEKTYNKELAMLDMLKEVIKGGGFKDLSQQVHLLISYSKLVFLTNIGVKFRITFLAF